MVDFKKKLEELKVELDQYSSSSLQSVDDCSLKYRLRYIDHVPFVGKKNIYAALGTAFHKAAEIFYGEGALDKKKFDRRFLLGLWRDCFNEAFADPDIERVSQEKRNGFMRQGYPILQRFFSTQAKDGFLKPNISNELEFKFPFTTNSGQNITLTGKIDYLAYDEDNDEIIIGDYKTSKAERLTEKQLRKSIQLPLYSLAFRWLFKNKNEEYKFKTKDHRVTLFYTRSGEKVDAKIKKIHRILLKKKIDRLVNKVLSLKKMKLKDVKPEPSDKACKYCPYIDVCPAHGNKLPEIRKVDLIPGKLDLGNFKRKIKVDGIKKTFQQFQEEDVIYMAKARETLNANQVGTGKTPEIIALVEHLRVTKGLKKVLLIAPKILLKQWKQEIYDWTGKHTYRTVKGSQKKRAKIYGKKLWTLTNFEKMKGDIGTVFTIPWDLIVIDEAQRIGGASAKSSRLIRMLTARWKIAMTGTPIGARLEKLFRIMAFVKPGLFPPWNVFRNMFIEYEGKGNSGKIEKYKNLDKVQDFLKGHFIRRKKSDVWKDLKEPIVKPVFVEMSKKQKMLYDDEVNELQKLLEEEGGNESEIVRFLETPAGARYIRIRSMLGCTQTVDPDGKFDSPKYDAMLPIIEDILDNDEKVIIFSQFRKIINIIQRELIKVYPNNVLRITGSRKEDNMDRDETKKLFMTDKKKKILLMTDAGQYGLNLQKGSYIINFEAPESPEVVTQRIGRVHRPGQEKEVNVINLIVRKSIEEKIYHRRVNKAKVSRIIIDGDKSLGNEVRFEDIKSTMSIEDLKELLI